MKIPHFPGDQLHYWSQILPNSLIFFYLNLCRCGLVPPPHSVCLLEHVWLLSTSPSCLAGAPSPSCLVTRTCLAGAPSPLYLVTRTCLAGAPSPLYLVTRMCLAGATSPLYLVTRTCLAGATSPSFLVTRTCLAVINLPLVSGWCPLPLVLLDTRGRWHQPDMF